MLLLMGVIFICLQFYSCASMHTSASLGLRLQSGPYGPRLTPTMNVGVYGGGGGYRH